MEKVYEKEGMLFKFLPCLLIFIYIFMCLLGSSVYASNTDNNYKKSLSFIDDSIKYNISLYCPFDNPNVVLIRRTYDRYSRGEFCLAFSEGSFKYQSDTSGSVSNILTMSGSNLYYINFDLSDSNSITFSLDSFSNDSYNIGAWDTFEIVFSSSDIYEFDGSTIHFQANGSLERGTGDNDSSNSVSGGNTTVDGSGDEDSDSGWLDNLWNWFSNISDKIGNIANAIGETIGSIFSPLWDFITSILDWLNPFSDNFILLKLWDFLGSLVSYLNPFSENFILLKLWDFLTTVISYINPFDDNFLGKKIVELIGDLLQFLFIPSDDYFSNLKETFLSEIESKIPYDDYITMFSTVLDISTDGQLEDVSISDYKVADDLTLNVPSFIDFSFITKYRSTWYGWVRGIVFILLIIYHINQINKLLRGINVADGSGNSSITFISTNSNALSSGNDKMLGGGK